MNSIEIDRLPMFFKKSFGSSNRDVLFALLKAGAC